MNMLLVDCEVFTKCGVVYFAFSDGSVSPATQVGELLDHFAEEIEDFYPEAYAALSRIYAAAALNRVLHRRQIALRFLKCNFSPIDDKPDIVRGSFRNFEYVPCPLRGECQFEGIICGAKIKPALRPSEQKVLAAWYEGLSEEEIADMLCLSIFTVHNHIRNAYARLGVHSRSEFVKYVCSHNLFPS